MARLNIRLFGAFTVDFDGLAVTHFESQKVRALLAFLAAESGQAHCRDSLSGLLWPDEPDRVARDNLRQALTNLRHIIGDRTATPPFLLIVHDTIRFNTASDHAIDVGDFQALLAACRRHAHRHPDACRSCAGRLAAAVELYRGDFLAQMYINSAPFEEWALLLRERLHLQVLEASSRLATYHERCGEYEEALRYARRQLEMEPWCEEAHRQAMRALALCGQRSAALAQYERCRQTLAVELHAEPAAETNTLYHQIRTGTVREIHTPAEQSVLPKCLPVPVTPIVGRERELSELEALLENPGCRLVTIIGPSGIGKSRLALEGATRQAAIFAHGVFFVPLTGLDNPEFLPQTIGTALGIVLSGPIEPALQLARYLRNKQTLLILENFERLLPGPTSSSAGPLLLSTILQAAPGVTLLVTSTQRLNLQAEWVFELGGLAYPSGSASADENPAEYGAVNLFMHLARRAGGHLTGAGPERAAVVRLCQAVEGMPLAIELAAAWSSAWSPQALAERIEQGLDPLATPLHDLPARHRSLQAVFDDAWCLLDDEERSALARISVFQGGFEEEAALQVTGAGPPVLRALAAKSVLRRGMNGRWDVHQFLRPYAAGRLCAAGQAEEARGKHLRYFTELSETAAPGLAGPEQRAWQERLEQEHGNLRAALGWALEQRQVEMAACLCCAIWYFWSLGGHYSEGRHWLARVREAAAGAVLPDSLYAEVLNVSGILAQYQGALREASALCEESLALSRRIGNQRGIYRALAVLSIVARAQGELRKARAYLEEGLGIVTPGTRPPSANAGWVIEYDMDRERSDYRHFDLAAPLPELCQLACARDQKCWAYVYAEPGLRSEHAHCFLKSVAPAGVPRAGYISGVKVWGDWEMGWDREQNDYREFPIGSADECMRQCLADRACWAIAYSEPGVRGSQAHCWLKSLGPAPVQRAGFVSALKTFGPLTGLKGVSWTAVQSCPTSPAYQEDLQDGRAQGWDLQAGWRIENPSGSPVLAGRGHQWATLKGNGWQDYEFSLWLTLQRGTIHLNYRNGPGPNRYFVGFQEGGLYLKKQEGNRFTDLASSAVSHTVGEPHLVQIVGRGGRIEVFVDGVKEVDYTDAAKPIRAGTIALETLDNSYAQVTGIQVCQR